MALSMFYFLFTGAIRVNRPDLMTSTPIEILAMIEATVIHAQARPEAICHAAGALAMPLHDIIARGTFHTPD